MERFSTAPGVIKTFCENGQCTMQTVRKRRTIFDRNKAPCEPTFRRLMAQFETTGSVLSVKSSGRRRS